MKQECLKWLMRGGTTVLLAGAVGLLLWQGTRHVSERELSARPQRLAAATVETTGTEATVSAAETTLHTGTRRTKTASAKRAGQAFQETRTAPESTTPAAETVTFPLELNAASAAELEQLPHIGAVLAERITVYRDQIGGFSNREQLLEVEGIGEATLYEIYDLLYLEYETFPEPEPEPKTGRSSRTSGSTAAGRNGSACNRTTGGSCTGSDVPAGSESGDGGGTGTDSRDAAGTGGEDRGVSAADSGVFVGI